MHRSVGGRPEPGKGTAALQMRLPIRFRLAALRPGSAAAGPLAQPLQFAGPLLALDAAQLREQGVQVTAGQLPVGLPFHGAGFMAANEKGHTCGHCVRRTYKFSAVMNSAATQQSPEEFL